MRLIFIIAAMLLFTRVTNLVQLTCVMDPDAVAMLYDNESEEDKKTEPDGKKLDKQLHNLEYTVYLCTYIDQQRNFTSTGLCMKGHCPLLDQPPEMC